MEAWLALRSIATLPLRLERSCSMRRRSRSFWRRGREVESVLYPGLKTHPGHEIAQRQMRYFGPVLGFALRDQGGGGDVSGEGEAGDGGDELRRND